jgi:hypothetical protein
MGLADAKLRTICNGSIRAMLIGAGLKEERSCFQVGLRESAKNWLEPLVYPKTRGMTIASDLTTADSLLGL